MKSNQHELMNEYLDWYENLLTDKQKEVMNLYYREDYSLAEIAENSSISRSAVSDLLKRVELTLNNYEANLGLVQKYHLRDQLYKQLNDLNNNEVNKIVNQLYDCES